MILQIHISTLIVKLRICGFFINMKQILFIIKIKRKRAVGYIILYIKSVLREP